MNRMFKKQNLFEIELICNIINVFTVTFDYLMHPCWIHLSKINLTDPKLFNSSIYNSIYYILYNSIYWICIYLNLDNALF